MKKRLIINADDYGLSSHVADAILELAGIGAISSTTIMANMASVDDLNKINSIERISTGLHFNILEGKPVSAPEQVYSLLDQSGRFFSLNVFLSKYMLKNIRTDHIEKEFLAQLNLLKANELSVSHADSHKHIHQFPFIGSLIQDIFLRHGIRKVRNCRVTDESAIRTGLYRSVWELAKLKNKKLISPDTLISSFWPARDNYQGVFANSIKNAFQHYDTVEFMTHPATVNEVNSKLDRKAEYLFWKGGKWKGLLEKMGVTLISFDEL